MRVLICGDRGLCENDKLISWFGSSVQFVGRSVCRSVGRCCVAATAGVYKEGYGIDG